MNESIPFEDDEILTESVKANGFFNGDVNIDINVTDPATDGSYSGIKEITYYLEANNGIKKSDTVQLYYNEKADEKNPSDYAKWEDLKDKLNYSISIDPEEYNYSDVTAYFTVTDNAGNSICRYVTFDIDFTAPVIEVKYDDEQNTDAEEDYFTSRTATVTITERSNHFDPDAATAGINITAVNANGESVINENTYKISDWKTVTDPENSDNDTHTATIEFIADANYTFDVAYTDMANNAAEKYGPDEFTVDNTAPEEPHITATIIKDYDNENDKITKEWYELRNQEFTFGFWSIKGFDIDGTVVDETSPINKAEYYKVKFERSDDEPEMLNPLTVDELEKVTDWNKFENLDFDSDVDDCNQYKFGDIRLEDDEQCVVYVKLTDKAGNITYISTNGLIVDSKHPEYEQIAPDIKFNLKQPETGIFSGDVNVDVTIFDPKNNGTYSGLKSVSYKVFNDAQSKTEPTQEGFLLDPNSFPEDFDPTQDELIQKISERLLVESDKNNSNKVRVVVYAVDFSGNGCEKSIDLKIDTTAPVIDISYDNNKADSSEFFKADRTATIKITERNFNSEDVVVKITNTDGKVPSISAWKTVAGTGNKDNTTHIAKIHYSADGDYKFKIEYTDLAGNKNGKVNYAKGTVAAEKFTLDKTLPVVSVSYDNNNAHNGKYFSANRTATVVIKEHNFDVSRVTFTQTASLSGTKFKAPAASWTNNGDTHIATIKYAKDGDYKFDVSLKDKAGNTSKAASYGVSAAGKDFTIDTAINAPDIGGIVNGKAYKDDVIPSVSFSDVNFNSYEIKVTKTERSSKNVDVTSKFINGIGKKATGGSGSFNTFDKVPENDGIYTIFAKITDKAGNQSAKSATFIVNRFGSVYEYSDYLCELIKDGGQYIKLEKGAEQAITEDLVITEYNADKLVPGSTKIRITRDGELIDVDYSSDNVTGNGWYENKYTIKTKNFIEDGLYKISISSDDATGNSSTSVPENSVDKDGKNIVDTMSFTVDTTAPEISNIINLEKAIADKANIVNGKLTVKYTIVDVGEIASIQVYLNGKKYGDPITDLGNMSSYSGEFEIGESNDIQTVRLVVEDNAGNVTDTDSADFNPGDLYVFNKQITVSSNIFVRWYRNTALFIGSIVGVVAVAGGLLLIIAKKKKKDEDQ